MNPHNPYRAPTADFSSSMAASAAPGDLGAVVQSFSETKPWLRLISTVGFLGVGFSLIGFLMIALFGGGAGGFAFSVMTFVLVLVYGIPLVQLHLYANAIAELVRQPDMTHLDLTVRRQRSFWRTVGILFLLSVLLSVATAITAPFL